MGFLTDASQFLNGGSDSQSNSQSGFALLPPELQEAFKNYAGQVNGTFANGGANAAFTPLAQTSYETNALNAIGKGTTPTADSIQSDIAMQMNPFNDSVINGINRQANGDYSILKQAQNEAGQLGSNRGLLGANDIEQTRLDTIGKFQQDQYNTALNNSLGTLTNSRNTDIANNFSAGDFLRNLDTNTNQAGVNALTSFGGLLGAIPQTGGSTSSATETKQNGASGNIAALAAMFSDRRIKKDIKLVGHAKGLGIYEFSYKHDVKGRRYRGVMAQQVRLRYPEAVVEIGGLLAVNYNALGLQMTEVN